MKSHESMDVNISNPSTILVVEKFNLFASAIKTMLETEQVRANILTVSSIDSLTDAFSIANISLVILGSTTSAHDAISLIKRTSDNIPIAYFQLETNADVLTEAFMSGASGLFSAETTQSEFAKGVVELLNGRRYAPATALHDYVSRTLPRQNGITAPTGEKSSPGPKRSEHLELHFSPREHQIIHLMSTGATNKEIARRLGISVGTTKNHVATILQRFGVSSRVKLVASFYDHKPAMRIGNQTP